MQNTSHLLMVQPVNFCFNAETAVNNNFQKNKSSDLQNSALVEFNNFVSLLQKNKVAVTVVKDTLEPHTPDSIFPNNWISFHEDGSIFLYPMFAPNRRLERNESILNVIKEKFAINKSIDLTHFEKHQLYLEGTGSMVLDRHNKLAYACISPRTDIDLLNEFCKLSNFTAVIFAGTDINGDSIYHTNVMLCIADKYAVICLDAINIDREKNEVINSLTETKKEIIDISLQQLNSFAGNMLQVLSIDKEPLLVMSTQAFESLNAEQIKKLEKYNRIIHSSLDIIEAAGGGSARCMLAEIFLPLKELS